MTDEATIEATMQVFSCSREEAIERIKPFEATTEDRERAHFLIDLFEHHTMANDFELAFWRDNKTLCHSSNPMWSFYQREWIDERMEIYLPRMHREPQ